MSNITLLDTLTKSKISHPPESLNADKIQVVVNVLRNSKKLNASVRFISVALKEQLKKEVHNYPSVNGITQEAFFVLFDNDKNECYEALLLCAGLN